MAGYIYILTNPSFPDYVKLGFATNMEKRLKQLNRSECIPFAFRVYATYETPTELSDLSLHKIIDKLNPNLRSIDIFNGKPRKKEFYAMTAEDAYSLLEAIAEMHGRTDSLKLYKASQQEKSDESTAEIIKEEAVTKYKSQPISLDEHLNSKNPEVVELYKMLQAQVYTQLPKADMYVLPQYIGWRVNGKYFAEFHLQRNRLLVHTARPDKEFAIGENVPDHFGWSLNYRAYMDTMTELEDAAEIIRQSYAVKSGKTVPVQKPIQTTEKVSHRHPAQPLTFAMLGIPVGTVLEYVYDKSIIVTTVDDKNKVEYNGQIISISRAAMMIRGTQAEQGGQHFLWKGKRLTEWRKEIEARED